MFEVFYRRPRDLERERRISEVTTAHGGRLDYFEETDTSISQSITLTFVFDDPKKTEVAESTLLSLGYHVEGISDYPA